MGSWSAATPRTRRVGLGLFVTGSAALAATVLAIGAPAITLQPADTMHMLVQGDYLARGYRPYVDFHSPHGFFPFLFVALGIALRGMSLEALVDGRLVAAMILGACFYRIAATRLHALWALFFALSTEALLVSLTPIGYRVWREYSFAMWYNALGFAIQAIVFLYTLLASASASVFGRAVDAAIVGALLASLFHTKLSFFLPLAVVFVAGTLIAPREDRRRSAAVGALLAAGTTQLALTALTGVSTWGYLSFLASLRPRVDPLLLLLRYTQYTRTLSLLLVALALVVTMAWRLGRVRELRREWGLVALMAAGMFVATSTSTQDPEAIPFLGLLPLAAAAALFRRVASAAPRRGPAAMLALLVLALDLHAPKNALLSLPLSRIGLPALSAEVAAATELDPRSMSLLSRRVDPALPARLPAGFVAPVADALRLLAEAGADAGDVLLVATAADNVTVFTDLRYPRGGSPWWFLNLTGPEAYPLPDPRFLADTRWILRPKGDDRFWRFLEARRAEALRSEFAHRSESADWILYERIAPARS